MNAQPSNLVQFTQKYSILFIVVILSISFGYVVYGANVTPSISQNDSIYAAKFERANVSELSLKDIETTNSVKTEKIIVEQEEIPFSVVAIGNQRSGTGTVLAEGKNGIKEVTYKAEYVNEELENMSEISNTIKSEPANKVVSYASKSYVTSRGDLIYRQEGSDIPVESYKKVIKMRYTAYCLCKKCCGKNPSHPAYGVTASGYKITPGINEKIVAIDPSVIKLGTSVYVENLSGKEDYGYALAADTGGAIKGNRIDLYIDDHKEALKVGTGYANVYVLD